MSIRYITVIEDSAFSLLARLKDSDGDYLTQADVSSIDYSVTRVDAAAVGTGTLDKADVIFDTIQKDSKWTEDSQGYNFLWPVDPTLIPDGGVHYRFEIKITPVTGYQFLVLWDVYAEAVYGS